MRKNGLLFEKMNSKSRYSHNRLSRREKEEQQISGMKMENRKEIDGIKWISLAGQER